MSTTHKETKTRRYAIGKVGISAITMAQTLELLDRQAKICKPAYVCVANSRVVVLSQEDEEFCRIQNNSFLTIPDGMPLVWYAKISGLSNVEKVSGIDLMMRVLSVSKKRGYNHYFYGSTEGVLRSMKINLIKKFGDLDIRGMVSPPFRPLTEQEKIATAKEINRMKPTFVWVGLGAPKQEFWMRDMMERIDSSILIGVGAAFLFAAGKVHRPPQWICRIGLEGLSRCIQQPFVIIPRFIKPFFIISGMLLRQSFHRLSRKARFLRD